MNKTKSKTYYKPNFLVYTRIKLQTQLILSHVPFISPNVETKGDIFSCNLSKFVKIPK